MDLEHAFERADEMVENSAVDLGPYDVRDVVRLIEELISAQLGRLADLGDDAEENEYRLRHHISEIAIKAFCAGVLASSPQSAGFVVPVTADVLEQLALGAIRDGVLSFHLVTPVEEDD